MVAADTAMDTVRSARAESLIGREATTCSRGVR